METYTEYAEAERTAFEAFRITYAQKNPPPRKEGGVSAAKDPEFYLLILVAVASVLLTSLRTAEAFFRSAANSELGEWAGWTEAALAILAIEGSMVVYSMIRAKHNHSVHDGRIYIFGIVVLAVISIVAALGQSINLMTEIPEEVNAYLQWGLTLVIGPGGALAAVIGGHLLGSRLADLNQINEEGSDDYKSEISEWRDALNRSWNANRKKYIGEYSTAPARLPEVPVQTGRKFAYGELKATIVDWYQTNGYSLEAEIDFEHIAHEIDADPESVRTTIYKLKKEQIR
jgi:hypothetical protein